jgi:hypothetical protein
VAFRLGVRIRAVEQQPENAGPGDHLAQQLQPLGDGTAGNDADTGDIAARAIEALDQTQPDGVPSRGKHQGNAPGRLLRSDCDGIAADRRYDGNGVTR